MYAFVVLCSRLWGLAGPMGLGHRPWAPRLLTGLAIGVLALGGAQRAAAQSIDTGNIDFGTVFVGVANNANLSIGNAAAGDAPDLAITEVAFAEAGSDDCAQFELSVPDPLPILIPPETSANIPVAFAPTAAAPVTCTVAITSNDGGNSGTNTTVVLSGTGQLGPQIDVNAPDVLDLGAVPVNTAGPNQTVTIANTAAAGAGALTVTAVSLAGEHASEFSAAPNQGTVEPGAPPLAIGINCNPKVIGVRVAELVIASNDPDTPVFVIDLMCTGLDVADIDINPPSLDFGNQTLGQPSTPLVLTVANATGIRQDLTVTEIAIEGAQAGNFAITPGSIGPVPAGEAAYLEITFTPGIIGDHLATVRINSNDPDEPSQLIALRGTGIAPVNNTQPLSIDFDNVGVGQSSLTQRVTTRNDGNADLDIVGVTIDTGDVNDFSFSGVTNVTLPPGASGFWDVVCTPSQNGSRNSKLKIPSNDPARSVIEVDLRCNGVDVDLALEPLPNFPDTYVGVEATPITSLLRNNSDLPVIVTGLIVSDAAFTVVNAPSLPFTLEKDVEVPLEIHFLPTENRSYAAQLQVITDLKADIFPLNGRGVQAEMLVDPSDYDFGDIRVGTESPRRTITIANFGTAPFQLLSVAIDKPEQFALSAPAGPLTLNPSGQANSSITMELVASPQTIGESTATITVQTDIPGQTVQTLPVRVNGIAPDMLLSQSAIDFGGVDVQSLTPTRQTITLTNTGSLDLVISNIDVAGAGEEWFQLADGQNRSGIVPVGATFDIAVEYQPTIERANELDTALIIQSDAFGSPEAVIPLRGRGIDRHISVSALALEFPETYRNPAEPERLPLAITNTGDAPLAISAIMTEGLGADAFAIANDSAMAPVMSVAPGATATLEVTFAPKAASGAPFEGTVLIINDDDDQPRVEVALRGIGVAPNVAMTPGAGITISSGTGVPVRLSAVARPIGLINLDRVPFTVRAVGVVHLDGSPMETGPFRIVGFTPSSELAADQRLDIDVEFYPDRPGTFAAMVEVYLDADPQPVSFVTIRGEAIDVELRGGGCGIAPAGSNATAGTAGVLLVSLLFLPLVAAARRRPAMRRWPAPSRTPGPLLMLLAASALAMTGAARAYADHPRNLELSTFRPALGVEVGMLAVEDATIGPDGAWSIGLALDHAVNPLTVQAVGANMRDAPITARTAMDLRVAYAFLHRFEAGVSLLMLQQNGRAPTFSGLEPATGLAIGDVAMHGKAAIWEDERWQLAGSTTITLPTATDGQFAGSNGPSVHARGIAGLEVTPELRVSLNTGARWRQNSRLGSITQGSELTYGAAAAYRILPALTAMGEMFGAVGLGTAGAVNSLEMAVGGRYRLTRQLAVATGVGRGLLTGVGSPDVRAFVLVSYSPAARAIPVPVASEPEVAPRDLGDDDGDGVRNDADQCPAEKEDRDGFQDQDGCLDPDNDNDGRIDRTDKCPDQAEDLDNFEDEDGCPEGDNDGDGIDDSIDQCPEVPEDRDGFADEDGCDDPDNDWDGVPDVIDQCVTEAETINGIRDDDGCPDQGDGLVIVLSDRLELFEPIRFRGTSARIQYRSNKVLDQVAAVLRAHPEFVRIRIGVHVHPRDQRDQSRSEERAQAVKEWLVARGTEPDRIEVKGYGATRLLLREDQRNAKQVNDRVELVIVARDPAHTR